MRHAFLITAYRNRDQLVNLIDTLTTDQSHVFVHLDEKAEFAPADVISATKRPADVTMASPQLKVMWGGFSQLAAILLLLRTAHRQGPFGYFHLLTGQCYPTKSMEEIYRFFEENQGNEYIESFLLPSSRWDHGGLNRMVYYHMSDLLDAHKQVLGVRVNYYFNDMFVRLQRAIGVRRELPGSYPTYHGGSGHFSLSGACVEYVLNELRDRPDLESAFRYTFCSEELLFQTVIANSPFRDRVAASNLRYIDFRYRNGNIPANLDESDFEPILSAGALFARKFDPVHSRVLLERLQRQADIDLS